MSSLTLTVLSLAVSASPADLEAGAAKHVTEQFGRVGRPAPQLDPSLSKAARILARKALEGGASEAAEMSAVGEAVSQAEGSDPSPRVYVIRGSPPEHALESFLSRTDLNQEQASLMGIGAQIANGNGAIVALLSVRKAQLKPFPRSVAKSGGSADLCGALIPPLKSPKVFVTRPAGEADRVSLFQDTEAGFCARIRFPAEGRYSVEVIGQGDRGAEIASLFIVSVGSANQEQPPLRVTEPRTIPEARGAILVRINSMRALNGLPPLDPDSGLEGVAQGYSERMSAENFFAHISPDGLDLKSRLRKVGYLYQLAGENLGLASGAVAAHLTIEQSPGHRRNLLDRNFTRIGIGIAFSKRTDHPQALVTEVLAQPSLTRREDPIQQAYQVVQKKRADLHLPALMRNQVLEQIAIDHVHRALEMDQPKAELPGSPVRDRIFAALREVSTTSVEFFVSDSPALITSSKSLADRKNDLVGIGAIRGDSSTYGRGKYWVVVIYAAERDRKRGAP